MKTLPSSPYQPRPGRWLLITGVWACCIPSAVAQGAGESPLPLGDLPSRTLEGVTITGRPDRAVDLDQSSSAASRLGVTLRQLPVSAEVISRELMEQRGARTLEEALAGAAGITVGGNPGSPGIASTRGFTGGFLTYLFDGARISTPTMSNRPQDSFNYERIEVLRGPASVLFGEGGIGGAVNFVPKRADRSQRGAEALLSYGSYGALRAGVGVGGALGSHGAYRFDYSRNQRSGWMDRNGQTLDHLTSALAFEPVRDVRLDLSLDYLRDDIESYWGTPLVPREFAQQPSDAVSDAAGRVIDRAMARTNFNVADGRMVTDSLWVRGRVTWNFAPRWQLRNELGYYSADRHWRNAESAVFVSPGLIQRDQVDIAHQHKVVTQRLDLLSTTPLMGLPNRFSTGVEWSRTDFKTQRRFSDGSSSTQAALQVSAFNPEVGRFNSSPLLATGAGNRTDMGTGISTLAWFAENALTLLPGLTVVGGMRTERIALDRRIDDLNQSSTTAFDKTYRPTSWRLGLVQALSPATALYASYADAAAPVGTSNLLLLSAANAAFPLTRGTQVEVGLKQTLAEQRIDWTLAVYDIEQKDILSRDPQNPAVTVNNGVIGSRGIELTAGWRATRQLTLAGNFTVLDAEFRSLVEAGKVSRVGNTPPNVPERVGRLWVDYRLQDLPVSVGMAYAHTGPMYTNNANTVRINRSDLWDIYASWRVRQALLSLRVRNLTNALYGTWSGASAGNQVVLGAPRTVELSARMEF